jgi:hypothetical protein
MTDKQRQLIQKLLREKDTLELNHNLVVLIRETVEGKRAANRTIASSMIDTLLSLPYRPR